MNRRTFLSTSAAGLACIPSGVPNGPPQVGQRSLANIAPRLAALHDLLEKHCRRAGEPMSVGCAISTDFLTRALQSQLRNAKSLYAELSYPTALPHISAGLELDLTALGLSAANGKLVLSGFTPTIVLREPTGARRAYGRIRIPFDPVSLGIVPLASDRDSIQLAPIAVPIFQSLPSTPDLPVLADNGLTLNDYKLSEKAILFSTAPANILDMFVASMPLPSALSAMRVFEIDLPRNITYDGGYIVISGPVRAYFPHNPDRFPE